MARRLTALYPFLFAAVYLVYLAWQSPGYYEVDDLLLILGFVLAGTGLVYLVAAGIFRDRAEGRLPAAIAFVVLISSLGLPFVFTLLHGLPRSARLAATALVGLAVALPLVGWLSRRPRLLEFSATLLTLTGALLLVRFGVAIGAARLTAGEEVEESGLASVLARPIPGPALVLRAVTGILRSSAVPPVILLQGDHGTSTLDYSDAPTAAQVDPDAAEERFGAFGAYYLPDSGAAAFGDTVTVVNVLGNVLRHYFGAELPPEPDDRYVSLERTPFEFSRGDGPPRSSYLERTPRASHPETSGGMPSTRDPPRLRGSC